MSKLLETVLDSFGPFLAISRGAEGAISMVHSGKMITELQNGTWRELCVISMEGFIAK